MADLSEIPENDIRSLERAMRVFGDSDITLDGNPADITPARLVPFLDKISRAFGHTGTDFAQGDRFDAAQFVNPESFEQSFKDISETIKGFRDSPHLGLIREIRSDSPDYGAIEEHLTAIGIPNPSDVTESIKGGLQRFDADTVIHNRYFGVLSTAASSDPNFAKLREILGDQAIDNIEQTIAVMDQSDTWMGVINAYRPEVPAGPNDTAELDASAAAIAAEIDVNQAASSDAKTDRIKAVETLLGVEADGVWGAEEQNALKTRIAEMQNNDPTWVGRKDGVMTAKFAEYVLGDVPGYDNFNDADKAFIQQINGLKLDNVPLSADVQDPVTSNDVTAAIKVVQEGLGRLVPIVQGELDQKRAQAEGLIDSINGTRASQMQRDAAEEQLARLSNKSEGELTDEDRQVIEEAQGVLDQSSTADNIGNFIDGFLGLGYTSLGHRLVQTGKEWSTNMIRGQLAGIDDLPAVDSLNLTDDRLDINEQRALQGVTYLLARKFGVPGNDHWHYTPELGAQLLAKFENLDDDEKLLLLDDEKRAAYNAKGDDASRKSFLDAQFEEEKNNTIALMAAMDTLYEAGVLVPQRLYHAEEIIIAPFTRTIFDEYMHGADKPFAGEPRLPASTQDLNMLNEMVYEFTQGLDLAAVMDEGYVFPVGIDAIDPTQTIAERFKARYQEGIDSDAMLGLLDTLPFGTQARRDQMKAVSQSSLDAVKAKKEEDPDVSADVLAAIYGNAMEAGINAMNDNPDMASDYLFVGQRPLMVDPRLGDTISPDSNISVADVIDLHEKQDQFFGDDPFMYNYEPVFFKGEDGKTYVAAQDYLSNVLTVQEVDLEHWDQVLRDTPKLPGENQHAFDVRLDEALSQVKGHDLIFQNNFEENQATLVNGTSATRFPDLLRARNVQSFDVVKAEITGEYDANVAAAAAADRAALIKAATPVGQGATEAFQRATEGVSPSAIRTPGAEFRQTGQELTTPVVPTSDGTIPAPAPRTQQLGVSGSP
ncbi:MAG: hypothetical protein GW778_01040 [Alphaproteobacteria bacterium]|nr:hypothetical protein [Alphaproteobacteria bacterium]